MAINAQDISCECYVYSKDIIEIAELLGSLPTPVRRVRVDPCEGLLLTENFPNAQLHTTGKSEWGLMLSGCDGYNVPFLLCAIGESWYLEANGTNVERIRMYAAASAPLMFEVVAPKQINHPRR